MQKPRLSPCNFLVWNTHTRLIGLVVVGLALGSCGHGSSNSSSSADFNPALASAAAAAPFSFQSYPLPGVYGAASIDYRTPAHPVGASNDGHGNLTAIDLKAVGLFPIYVWPRVPYDIRSADFNGDGIPDVISTVYSPTSVDSWTYLYFGNADGTFTQDTTFGAQYTGPYAAGSGYRGRTETIVVADFTNSGAVDIFLPTYTYLDSTYDLSGDPSYSRGSTTPDVYNAVQSFLLLNDGTGKFVERAVQAGVSMHSALSALSPASADPDGNQPEGAQAVDFNMDGLIDLYAGGHLFINQGVDDQGVPHFTDMAAAYGLTAAMLRAAPPWNSALALPDNFLLTDEGALFLDWDNDGHLDLLLFRWDWGSAHGARLFEFNGTYFRERQYALRSPTPTCPRPPSGQQPIFASSGSLAPNGGAAGINAYDLDNMGLQDVLISGDANGSIVFRNTGCGFVEASAGDLSGKPGGSGGMALADFDGDGTIDVMYPTPTSVNYYLNTSGRGSHSFTVELLGPNGEHNQYGRVIQVFPPGANQVYTRVVDGGSGYLTQNQYPILVGTPYSGAHMVKVYFAPLTRCAYGGPPCHAAVLNFSIAPGQRAEAYAPSAAYPTGRVVVTN
jgi:hypothetical protein